MKTRRRACNLCGRPFEAWKWERFCRECKSRAREIDRRGVRRGVVARSLGDFKPLDDWMRRA